MMYFLILALFGNPQNNSEYIACNYLNAKVCELIYGIPSSVQFAQAILESGGGKSYIAKNSKNHFGMKHFSNDEHFFRGRKGVKWKAFSTVFWCYIYHAQFLSKYYSSGCFKPASYWAGFRGYGGEGYWKHIHKIINQQNLQKYDFR